MSGGVSGGVGKGVRPRVSGSRCVGVDPSGGNGDAAVAWRRLAGNGQPGTSIVREHRTVHRGLRWGAGAVVGGLRSHGQRHDRNRAQPKAVRCRVGEGIEAGVVGRRCVGVRAVGLHDDSSVCSSGVRRHGEADSKIVCQNRAAIERGVHRSGARVVGARSSNCHEDGSGSGLSSGVGGRVGERVETGVVRGRCVNVGAAGIDGDRAMGRRGMSGDGERCTRVVDQHRRAIDRRIGRRGDGVVRRLGRDRQRDGPCGRLSGGVGGGVGERVWARVSGRRGVGVGAVGRNRDSAVGWGGVAGDGQAGAEVVGKYRRPLECSVGRGEAGIAGGNRRHGQGDCGCRAVAGSVRGGVREGVRS